MATITTKAFGTKHSKGNLEPITIERRAPLPDDVTIKILYCGVCHTDLHQVNEDWEKNKYPLVPGHEIIGEVISVGASVSKFKVGDKVGVGFVAESCKSCSACRHDLEQHCKEMTSVCADDDKHFKSQQTFGGYSEMIVINQDYVVSIPTGLDLASAAPLLCAGITVYSPLSRYEVTKGTKVGVVGLGGLGHMGVKFALVMGAEVTVITQSDDKKEFALGLGAHKVINSEDAHQMEAYNDYFDLVLNTIPYAHDLSPFIKCVGPCGVLACVGLVGKVSKALDTTLLVFRGKSIAGSMCGGIKETQEMLDFSAKHGVSAEVEKINIRDVNDVYKRMLKSEVDHRYVIDMSTI